MDILLKDILVKKFFMRGQKMRSNLSTKVFPLLFSILLLGLFPIYSYPYPELELEKDNSNYYLGVLAKGYPSSLVVSEFKFANAQVVRIKDNMVLFGINEKTKLTTFMKNLPFLKEVYVDAKDIKGTTSLKKDSLAREFLNLLHGKRLKKPHSSASEEIGLQKTGEDAGKMKISAGPGTVAKKQAKKPGPSGNMALIDRLIREKAKGIRAKQIVEKQEQK
jgi:hypothetical protein